MHDDALVIVELDVRVPHIFIAQVLVSCILSALSIEAYILAKDLPIAGSKVHEPVCHEQISEAFNSSSEGETLNSHLDGVLGARKVTEVPN